MSEIVCEEIGEGSVPKTVLSVKFEWKIPKSFLHKQVSMYRSKDFQVSDLTFFLKISSTEQYIGFPGGYIRLHLHRSTGSYPVVADITLGIKTLNNTVANEKRATYMFNKDNQVWGCCKFVNRSKLLQRKSEMMPSDVLTVICSLEVKYSSVYSGYGNFAEDFKKLLNSKENSVTLYVRDTPYLAHMTILAARSPVFAAMFKNEMAEKRTGMVNITDCDPEAFHAFLTFLYSGFVDLTKCNVYELCKITDKYDMSELKLLCIDFIIRNLSVENICEALILSDQFNDAKLSSEIQRIFMENFEQIVMTSEKWEYLLTHKTNFAEFRAIRIMIYKKH